MVGITKLLIGLGRCSGPQELVLRTYSRTWSRGRGHRHCVTAQTLDRLPYVSQWDACIKIASWLEVGRATSLIYVLRLDTYLTPYNAAAHRRFKYVSVHSIVVLLSYLNNFLISLMPFSAVPFFSTDLLISSSIILTPAGVGPRSVPMYSHEPSSDVSAGSRVLVLSSRVAARLG